MVTNARKTAYPDATTVIAFSGEMAVSLKAIIDGFQTFAEKPAERPVSEQIRRLCDTARLVSLRALVRVGQEVAELARRIEQGEVAAGQGEIEALRHGLAAMHSYLVVAAEGKISSGLLLYPAYSDVMRHMPGRAPLNRGELFLPVMPVYGGNSPTFNSGRFIAEVARYSDEFETAMIRYTRDRGLATVNAMRTTLVTMETKNPPSNFRLFFNLAISFLDVAVRAGGKISKEDDPLLARIHREIKGVAAGELDVDDATLSWFMYIIAQAPQFSHRVRTIHELYDLQRMIEEDLGGVISEQTLATAKTSYENATRAWEAAFVTGGDVQAAKGACFALAANCNTLGDYALKTMSLAMGSLADNLASGGVARNSEMAVFGATVLLAIGERLERVVVDVKGGRAIADFHKDRVRAVISGKKPGELPADVAVHGGHSQGIIDEIVNDLQAAEQIIEQCLRDGGKEGKIDDKINDAVKLFEMTASALVFINLSEGSSFAQIIATEVRRMLRGVAEGHPLAADDRVKLAESVTLLQRYVWLVNMDRMQALMALEKGMALFTSVEPDASDTEEVDATFDQCRDQDLGPIFFEEARGVLTDNVLPGLARLRENPADTATLLEVRRGFHTLKGSARMIELNNLGMLGQCGEYALNVCRDHSEVKPTPALIDWLESIAMLFEQAVLVLERGKPAKVETLGFIKAFEHFRDKLVFPGDATDAPGEHADEAGESVHIPETGPVVRAVPATGTETVPSTFEPGSTQAGVDGAEIAESSRGSVPIIGDSNGRGPMIIGDSLRPQAVVETNQPQAVSESVGAVPRSIQQVPASTLTTVPATQTLEISPSVLAAEEVNRRTGAVTAEEAAAAENIPQTVAQSTPESQSDVRVGNVVIPNALYMAFTAESRKFFGQLEASLKALINGERSGVDFDTMRMAHSLAGMGRTTGLAGITALADRLESWIALNQDREISLDDVATATLGDVLEALDAMVSGVEELIEPAHEEELVRRLQQMIDRDEHEIAHGRSAERMLSGALLEKIEQGGLVSDSGVVSATPHQSGSQSGPMETAGGQTVTGDDLTGLFDQAMADIVRESANARRKLDEAEGIVESTIGSAMVSGDIVPPDVVQAEPPAADDEPDIVQETLPRGEPPPIGESVTEAAPETVFRAPDIGSTSAPKVHVDVEPETLSKAASVTRAAPAAAKGAPGEVDWLQIIQEKKDEIDAEMFGIFMEEAEDRFKEIDETLSALNDDIGDRKLSNTLKRSMHTLKGSANTAGARKIGALFHYLEDLMNQISVLTPEALSTIQSGVDAAFGAMHAIRDGKSAEQAILRAMRGNQAEPEVGSAAEIADSSTHPKYAGPERRASVIGPSTTVRPQGAPERRRPAAAQVPAARKDEDDNVLRVPVRTLDKMAKSVGEVSIVRTRVGNNIDLTRTALTGLSTSVDRLAQYARQIEREAEKQMSSGSSESPTDSRFDALQMDRFTRLQELTRRVAEAQNDILTQQSGALTAVRDMEEAMIAQFALLSEMSADLDLLRQVRVASIVPQLRRTVRQACRDTHRKGEFYVDADVEIDRGILEKVVGPLEHILRNAVAHGIESPSDRIKAGKDETGTIEFRSFQDGSDVVIEIRDDGRGIDANRVLTKAVERGLVKPGARITEHEVYDLLFLPGFSTATEVTEVAGRGVGLDVVRSDISALGGRVDLSSKPGEGSTFQLRVPATLTTIAGAAVTTNSHMYVVPAVFVDRLVRIGPRELEAAYASRTLTIEEGSSGNMVDYQFFGLWDIVGAPHWENRPVLHNSVLLMANGRIAVHVDDVRPASEFVFRPMGPQITVGSGLIGSTINALGNAALVIDPARIVRTLKSSRNAGERSVSIRQQRAPLVLIVDDSLTVRKVTSRLLKREGFRMMEAENGMQALERIHDERPDVILMDIEMPVMNGYETTQALRATPETRDIPIIMITSRVGESHQQAAFELGVNEYLGKPYNEGALIDMIRKHTGKAEALTA